MFFGFVLVRAAELFCHTLYQSVCIKTHSVPCIESISIFIFVEKCFRDGKRIRTFVIVLVGSGLSTLDTRYDL